MCAVYVQLANTVLEVQTIVQPAMLENILRAQARQFALIARSESIQEIREVSVSAVLQESILTM